MEITYNWKITELTKVPSKDGLTDVVTHIKFIYTGTSDQTDENGEFKKATFKGSVPALPPNSEDFKPLNSLTEADVIEWVKVIHPTDHMQSEIVGELTEANEQVLDLENLPW
jgi:hypothetical protein